mmetsp:Transcript_74312/g.209883  ORF Transcript_74312/g.209883 Transcript_74312/m.209883 type:complete len:427 (+) Transcript_74312:240-1520(+)
MAKAQAMLERPWARKAWTFAWTWRERACRNSLCRRDRAPKAQAMWESCGAEYRSTRRATCAPISAMSCRSWRPATAKAQVSIATSVDLKPPAWICVTAWPAMAPMRGSWEKLFFEKAQATFARSAGWAPRMPRWSSPATASKRARSWTRRFAKAQARCARSGALKCATRAVACSEMAAKRAASRTWRFANDHAVMAKGAGTNSDFFRCSSVAMASMRSSLRVPHSAMAQEMWERLCAVKVVIFFRHSAAMAATSCSFQRPHLAKAHAVFESCRWSKPPIWFTTSAAITDMSASSRTVREAKPQTMPAMSCGVKVSALYLAMSATFFRRSTTTASLSWNFPSAKAMSASSLGQISSSGAARRAWNRRNTSWSLGSFRVPRCSTFASFISSRVAFVTSCASRCSITAPWRSLPPASGAAWGTTSARAP